MEDDDPRAWSVWTRGARLAGIIKADPPPPNDASDKTWLRLTHWFRRYSRLKVLTDGRTDAGLTGIL